MRVRLHFQSTGTVPGNAGPATMLGGSITIGRGPSNDLVLPDPGKTISNRHCAIEETGGSVMLLDFSSNGTFLNYAKQPVGEVRAPLNDGDILTIGSYELMLEITAAPAEAAPQPYGAAPAASPSDAAALLDGAGAETDFLDDLLGEGAPVTGPASVHRADAPGEDGLLPPLDAHDLFGDPAPAPAPAQGASQMDHMPSAHDALSAAPLHQSVIPDDWDDDLLGTPDASAPLTHDPFAEPAETPTPPPPPPPPEPAPPAEATPPDAAPMAGVPNAAESQDNNNAAARAFLSAVGIDASAMSDAELMATMSRSGHVMKALIRGIREILMTRSAIKSEFRIQQTVIGAGGNNPLKFSVSPEQAVEAMLAPTQTGYLDPVAAADQALDDIKAHEVAMMTGMEAALRDVLQQLSPDQLETRISGDGGLGGLLKGRKARYWEVYEKMYAEIAERAESDFHENFGREFSRAYQDQLERLK